MQKEKRTFLFEDKERDSVDQDRRIYAEKDGSGITDLRQKQGIHCKRVTDGGRRKKERKTQKYNKW